MLAAWAKAVTQLWPAALCKHRLSRAAEEIAADRSGVTSPRDNWADDWTDRSESPSEAAKANENPPETPAEMGGREGGALLTSCPHFPPRRLTHLKSMEGGCTLPGPAAGFPPPPGVSVLGPSRPLSGSVAGASVTGKQSPEG